jgi:hypothetical protein
MKKDFAPWSEHALNEQLCGYTVAWEGNEMRTNVILLLIAFATRNSDKAYRSIDFMYCEERDVEVNHEMKLTSQETL